MSWSLKLFIVAVWVLYPFTFLCSILVYPVNYIHYCDGIYLRYKQRGFRLYFMSLCYGELSFGIIWYYCEIVDKPYIAFFPDLMEVSSLLLPLYTVVALFFIFFFWYYDLKLWYVSYDAFCVDTFSRKHNFVLHASLDI